MHTKLLSTKFIVVILLLTVNIAQAQSYYSKEKEVLDNIAMLIKDGEYNKLSDYFNNMVELRIPEKEGVFSKTQSKFILKDFFNENPPKSLEFEKWGESDNNNFYAILSYSCKEKEFRIYYIIKKPDEDYKIQLFHISPK